MATNLLRPTPVSSRLFTSDRETGLILAEASSVGPLDRVWSGARTVGFTILSSRTGRAVVFAEQGRKFNREGELVWTDFVSVSPDCKGFRARLFND